MREKGRDFCCASVHISHLPSATFTREFQIHYPTRSGPKRPAAAIGGDDFLGYMAQLDPFWFVDRR